MGDRTPVHLSTGQPANSPCYLDNLRPGQHIPTTTHPLTRVVGSAKGVGTMTERLSPVDAARQELADDLPDAPRHPAPDRGEGP